jgi:hypothetical protein
VPDTLRPTRNRDGSRTNDNVKVNKARLIANTAVHFLFGREVTFELDARGNADTTIETPAEIYLAAVWKANKKKTKLLKLGLNGAVAGHAFWKIVPGPSPLTGDLPRLVILDPATVDPTWDPEDLELVEAYEISYPGTDPKTGKPMLYRQLHQRLETQWTIVDQQKDPDALAWSTIQEVPWPYPFPAIVDCQNLPAPNQYWGTSDLEDDVLALNKARNFLLSNWLRIQRFHGHPKTWGKGFAAKDLETAVDATIVLPSKDATLANLEMTSDQAGADLLDRKLDDAIMELAAIPPVAAGKLDNVGQLSGLAIQILFSPIIARTEAKRLLYGELLEETNRRLLAIGGFGDANETSLKWPEVLPTDPMAEAQTALVEEQLGVSKSTLLQKLGYDPDTEADKKADELAEASARGAQAFDAGNDDVGDVELGPDGRPIGQQNGVPR